MAQPSTLARTPDTDTDIARLQLRPTDRPGRSAQFVDGGWWPRSCDLAVEIPGLLAALAAAGLRRPYRLMYDLDEWDAVPRRLMVAGHEFKPGGYHLRESDTITIVDPSGVNTGITLLVIRPDTDPAVAERALALAADAAGTERPAEILERAARP